MTCIDESCSSPETYACSACGRAFCAKHWVVEVDDLVETRTVQMVAFVGPMGVTPGPHPGAAPQARTDVVAVGRHLRSRRADGTWQIHPVPSELHEAPLTADEVTQYQQIWLTTAGCPHCRAATAEREVGLAVSTRVTRSLAQQAARLRLERGTWFETAINVALINDEARAELADIGLDAWALLKDVLRGYEYEFDRQLAKRACRRLPAVPLPTRKAEKGHLVLWNADANGTISGLYAGDEGWAFYHQTPQMGGFPWRRQRLTLSSAGPWTLYGAYVGLNHAVPELVRAIESGTPAEASWVSILSNSD